MCGWVNRKKNRRRSTAGTGYLGTICPKVQAYKNARTAWRYADARNITVIIVLIYFMSMSGILRCGAWAFFDHRVLGGLQKAKMDTATPSYGPPWGYWISKEKRRLWKSKPPLHIGVVIVLLYDGFFSFAIVRQLDFIYYWWAASASSRVSWPVLTASEIALSSSSAVE